MDDFTVKQKPKSIREIARLANVSTASVSRVINNPESTSPEIREKVMKVIEKYHYVPNFNVQSIFSGTSNTIAIFVYDMTNPFFIHLIRALNRIALDNEYTLIVCDTENQEEREASYMKYCQGTRAAGLIITEGSSRSMSYKAAHSMPVIFLDRLAENVPYPMISSDNRQGIRMAAEYLQNLNHTHIAFVAGPDNVWSARERKLAYCDFIEKKGLEVNPDYIFEGNLDVDTGKRAMDHFLSLHKRPTAVICANDLIAHGLVIRAQSLGLQIPDDLSVIGFDGVQSEWFYPQLTSVEQNVERIAEIIMSAFIKKTKLPKQTTVPVRLVIGDTCKRNP